MISRKQHKRDTAKKLAVGGTLAAVVGYLAGLLTAPQSGKETREDIKAAADKGRQDAERELKQLHTDLDSIIKDSKDRGEKLGKKAQTELNDLVEKAKDTKEKAREVLSAIHEGDAEDQDLKRAIKNANNALDHLRDYLKK